MYDRIVDGELIYLLALSHELVWNFTPRELEAIIMEFDSLSEFWNADETKIKDFAKTNHIKIEKIERFLSKRYKIDIKAFLDLKKELLNEKIRILLCTDNDYPPLLKQWNKPVKLTLNKFIYKPRVLFLKGNKIDLSNCISIIGTRKCSNEGAELAREIAAKLVKRGYTVVSGMAVGIDSAAHRGAIDALGKTLAVLPWLDPIYPPENIDLARDILKNGCLLSEFYKKNLIRLPFKVNLFLERDKIIAAISHKILIVETGVKGGAIRVANIAKKLGREIYVCMPKVHDRDKWNGFKRLRLYYNAKVYEDIDSFLSGKRVLE